MKSFLVSSLLLGVICSTLFVTSYAQSAAAVARLVFPSVVLIETKDASGKPIGLGSGFFVAPGVIATNFHVIEGSSKATVKIVGKAGTFDVLGVIGVDVQKDLALIKVNGITARPLPLSAGARITGEKIFTIGNPEGLEGSISEGIVSSAQLRQVGDSKFLQITAPISQGSSGGPVVNSKGEVIGVATAFLSEGQNLNFAAPATFLSSLLLETESSSISPLASVPRSKSKIRNELNKLQEIQKWVSAQFNQNPMQFSFSESDFPQRKGNGIDHSRYDFDGCDLLLQQRTEIRYKSRWNNDLEVRFIERLVPIKLSQIFNVRFRLDDPDVGWTEGYGRTFLRETVFSFIKTSGRIVYVGPLNLDWEIDHHFGGGYLQGPSIPQRDVSISFYRGTELKAFVTRDHEQYNQDVGDNLWISFRRGVDPLKFRDAFLQMAEICRAMEKQ